MENVSITLLVVLGLGALVMTVAVSMSVYALRMERQHLAAIGVSPEAVRIRAGSSSGDIHVIVRFASDAVPHELVAAIGGLMDIDGLRGVVADLVEALPNASHAHVSCAHFHDIRPKKIPGDATHIYLRVRTRRAVALPEGDVSRALVQTLLERCAALEAAALVEVSARVAKPSTDPAAARLAVLG